MDNAFGGNYSRGSGGGGGGFMANSSQNGGEGGEKRYGNNSLRPVTIYQVQNASQTSDSKYEIDGAEVEQITMVAAVRDVTEGQTNVTLRLDDGTGSMEAKVWKDSASDDTNMFADIQPNRYVRLVGNVKSFNNKINISAAYVRPVSDHNEWLFHKLDVAYVHLSLTRGEDAVGISGGRGGGAASRSGSGAGQQRGVGEYFKGANGAGGGAGGSSKNSKALSRSSELSTAVQRKVYEALVELAQENTDGVHINQIAKRVTAYNHETIEETLDTLSNEGFTFTTSDDCWLPSD